MLLESFVPRISFVAVLLLVGFLLTPFFKSDEQQAVVKNNQQSDDAEIEREIEAVSESVETNVVEIESVESNSGESPLIEIPIEITELKIDDSVFIEIEETDSLKTDNMALDQGTGDDGQSAVKESVVEIPEVEDGQEETSVSDSNPQAQPSEPELAETVDVQPKLESKAESEIVQELQNKLTQEVDDTPNFESIADMQIDDINYHETVVAMDSSLYTLQIYSASSTDQAVRRIRQYRSGLSAAVPFFIYHSPRQSGQWHPVLLGVFENYDSAKAYRSLLPQSIQNNKPLIRQFSKIQEIISEGL